MKMLQDSWTWIEYQANRAFTPAYNPLYYLGAICIFFMWVLLASGLYIFFFYEMTARGAYNSVQNLTVNQWYMGGVMRSAHRYASDGLVLTMVLHAVQTFATGRFRHWRWLAWVSGMGCVWFIVADGIFGYVLVWDERGQLAAQLSAIMLDALPILSKPISFAFTQVPSDFFFYILLFVHFIALVFLFMLLVVHVMRMNKARTNPPAKVVYALIFILLAMSSIAPATSTPPADLAKLPGEVPFDWFYFFIFPLIKNYSVPVVWALLVSITLILFFVPWYFPGKRDSAAEVIYENCTGCEQCVSDCPYEAVYVQPRSDKRNYDLEAVVNPERCASCGICVGACDYKAINLPFMREADVKAAIVASAKEIKIDSSVLRIFVFMCTKGVSANTITEISKNASMAFFLFPCIGMVQPSMISLPFNEGFDGLFVAGCQEGDCHYRNGNKWLADRIGGVRKPSLRKSVDRTKIRIFMSSSVQGKELLGEIEAFSGTLKERRASTNA